MRQVGAERGYVGVEMNKPDAIEALRGARRGDDGHRGRAAGGQVPPGRREDADRRDLPQGGAQRQAAPRPGDRGQQRGHRGGADRPVRDGEAADRARRHRDRTGRPPAGQPARAAGHAAAARSSTTAAGLDAGNAAGDLRRADDGPGAEAAGRAGDQGRLRRAGADPAGAAWSRKSRASAAAAASRPARCSSTLRAWPLLVRYERDRRALREYPHHGLLRVRQLLVLLPVQHPAGAADPGGQGDGPAAGEARIDASTPPRAGHQPPPRSCRPALSTRRVMFEVLLAVLPVVAAVGLLLRRWPRLLIVLAGDAGAVLTEWLLLTDRRGLGSLQGRQRPADRLSARPDPAAVDPAVDGLPRRRGRHRPGQGDLGRTGTEPVQPGAGRPGLPAGRVPHGP